LNSETNKTQNIDKINVTKTDQLPKVLLEGKISNPEVCKSNQLEANLFSLAEANEDKSISKGTQIGLQTNTTKPLNYEIHKIKQWEESNAPKNDQLPKDHSQGEKNNEKMEKPNLLETIPLSKDEYKRENPSKKYSQFGLPGHLINPSNSEINKPQNL
jgi:hypothetical protein